MAVPHNTYSMQIIIRYDGRLIDVLDRIRAVSLVLMVHIEEDLGPERELITIKVMTPHPPRDTFHSIRKWSLGKIESLKEMTLQESTLTRLL